MKYRPDVDGLRAIAILFVLFFHAGIKQFSSGFVGVDVFFVISGYLITRIIHESLETNQFSFLEFYSRRLWRMQPVYICLVILCFAVGLVYFLPDDFLLLVNSIHKSALFAANVFFEKVQNDYFAPNSLQLTLLHTWSLSIEWQCYFLLPIFIFLLYRLCSAKKRMTIIYLTTLFFFALSFYFSLQHLALMYFRLPARVFEFLIGSCIAVSPKKSTGNSKVSNSLCIIALTALFYVATRPDLNVGYPNCYALIVCLATAVLIAIGEQKPQPLVTRLLASKPFVFIGLISYSLYIWHWPLLAFLRYQGFEESALFMCLVLSIIFLVAWLSWRFIERPTRKLHVIGFKYTFLLLFIFPISLATLANITTKKEQGFPKRFPEFNKVLTLLKENESEQRKNCLQQKDERIPVDKHCILGSKKQHHRSALMIGDSFSNHLWGFMEPLAKDSNITILAHSFAGCLALPEIYQYSWNEKDKVYRGCHEQTKLYYSMISKNHYDMVIIAQHWDGYLQRGSIINNLDDKRSLDLTKKRLAEAVEKAIQLIIASGAKPVLVKTIGVDYNAYNCYYNHVKRDTSTRSCDFPLQQGEKLWFDNLFDAMKEKYDVLVTIDPKLVQCPEGYCKASFEGVPVFRDGSHLTDYAARFMGAQYLQQYRNPLDLG